MQIQFRTSNFSVYQKKKGAPLEHLWGLRSRCRIVFAFFTVGQG